MLTVVSKSTDVAEHVEWQVFFCVLKGPLGVPLGAPLGTVVIYIGTLGAFRAGSENISPD